MAERIINHQGLGSRAYFRSPSYFYLLAFLEYLSGGSFWAVRIFQSIVGSFTAMLAGFFAYRLTGRKWAAAISGLIVSCFWLSIYFDGELVFESMACFLNLLALYLLTFRSEKGRANVALSGFALGLAAIFRPNFLLFIAGVFGYWLYKKRYRDLAILAVCASILILPITIRNLVVAKDPVLIASQDGINFWAGNNLEADGRMVILPETRYQLDGEFLKRFKDDPWFREDVWLISVYNPEKAAGRPVKESEVSRYWMTTTFNEIAGDPGRWLKLMLKKCYFLVSRTTVSNNRDLDYHREQIPILSALGYFHLGIIMPVALLGILLGVREKKNLYLVLYFFLYGASVVLFFVTSRYMIPLFPALAVLAAVAVSQIIFLAKNKKWAWLAASLVLVAVFAFLSNSRLVKWNDRPLRSGMRYNLGMAMMARGRFEQAIKPLKESVEIKPSWPEANLALANALALSGKPQLSVRYYQDALFYSENFAEAHYDFGLTLIKLRQPEQAYDHLLEAHQIKPELFPTPEQVLESLSKKSSD